MKAKNKDKYLHEFNYYAEKLKRLQFAGVADVSSYDEPYYLLTVPLATAMDELQHWSGQDISETELRKYLERNNIYIARDIDHWSYLKKQIKKRREKEYGEYMAKRQRKAHTKNISDEKRQELRERMLKINAERKAKREQQLAAA